MGRCTKRGLGEFVGHKSGQSRGETERKREREKPIEISDWEGVMETG